MKEPEPTLKVIKNRAIQQAAPMYRGAVTGWIKEANKMKSYDSPINPQLPAAITELIYKTLLVTYAMGRDAAEDKIQVLKRAEEREKKGKKAEFAIWQDIPWNSLGFDEALKIFKDKPIISADDFKEAEAAIKAIAFSVQRVEEANALILLKESIVKSIDTGIVFRDWKNALPELFERAGYVVTDPKLTPWHLETVFRTNQSSVYESANWDHYQADDYIIGLMYTTVGDNRVSEDHAQFNGFMAPKTDPIWLQLNPPLRYKCRCSTTPLSEFFMKENGFKFSKQEIGRARAAAGDAVHEHFSGKNGILHLDKKILRGLKEKYNIIESLS